MIKLFVGLGNPGPRVRSHAPQRRLLVGRRARARAQAHAGARHAATTAWSARANVHGQTLWLLQPQTFMNLSGKSVAALARFFKIAARGNPGGARRTRRGAGPGQAQVRRQPCRPQRPARHPCAAGHRRLLAAAPGHRPPGREVRGDQLGAEEAAAEQRDGHRGMHRPHAARPCRRCWPARWTRPRCWFTPASRRGPNRRGPKGV